MQSNQKYTFQKSPESKYTFYDDEDIGYGLGWLCGGLLIVGIIMSIIFRLKEKRRKAFQAIILPWGTIIWHFIIWHGISPKLLDPHRGLLLISYFAGIIFVPLILLRLLRSLSWPSNKESE